VAELKEEDQAPRVPSGALILTPAPTSTATQRATYMTCGTSSCRRSECDKGPAPEAVGDRSRFGLRETLEPSYWTGSS
jgi:hypothetical protein